MAHALDEAVALQPLGENTFGGATHPGFANMVGPFGGVTAATMLNAVLQHSARLGDPIALTVNFCAALADGAFSITARPVRTNRATQHWVLELSQADATGQSQVAITATALTGLRRDTWGSDDLAPPTVPRPDQVPQVESRPLPWLARYEARPIIGNIPSQWDGLATSTDPALASLSQLWMREVPPRALDFVALTAMADFFFPRIFLRRATRVPAGTVSMTVYFHANTALLAQTGTGYLLGQARAQVFRHGFFDQTAQLWNEAGLMLATTHQTVYYKE